jgi:hypothetical protein
MIGLVIQHAINSGNSHYGPTPYRFLHRISIRIQIGGKYAGVLCCVLRRLLLYVREGVVSVSITVSECSLFRQSSLRVGGREFFIRLEAERSG